MKHSLATLSPWPLTLHPAHPAAVAMKASVFSHTCPPHLLPHSLLPNFRVRLQERRPLSHCWLGSHPVVRPEQRGPHRPKTLKGESPHSALWQTHLQHLPGPLRPQRQKRCLPGPEQESVEELSVKYSNWQSCPMNGIPWCTEKLYLNCQDT